MKELGHAIWSSASTSHDNIRVLETLSQMQALTFAPSGTVIGKLSFSASVALTVLLPSLSLYATSTWGWERASSQSCMIFSDRMLLRIVSGIKLPLMGYIIWMIVAIVMMSSRGRPDPGITTLFKKERSNQCSTSIAAPI